MLVLVGKTATGKDTVFKYIVRYGLDPIVTYTTRPPRSNEVDGETYHFLTKEKFLKLKKEGFFAETTSYNVATGDTWYYGSAVEDYGKENTAIILNPDGLKQLKENNVDFVSFLITASDKTIMSRLERRGDKKDEAERRLKADKEDFKDIYDLVDFSFSNDLGVEPSMLAFLICHAYNVVMESRKE